MVGILQDLSVSGTQVSETLLPITEAASFEKEGDPLYTISQRNIFHVKVKPYISQVYECGVSVKTYAQVGEEQLTSL